jgi:hypothetical protein
MIGSGSYVLLSVRTKNFNVIRWSNELTKRDACQRDWDGLLMTF